MKQDLEKMLLAEQVNTQKATIEILSARLSANDRMVAELQALLRQKELQNESLNASIRDLQGIIQTLREEIKGLTDKLGQAGVDIMKLTLDKKNLAQMVDGKHSEKSKKAQPKPQAAKAGSNKNPKERGNNGAKRDPHIECEAETLDVMPSDPDFDPDKARFIGTHTVTRYIAVPMRFIKRQYILHAYEQNGRIMAGQAPKAPLFNSNFDGSFIAAIAELRYIYSMPVERIVKYFREKGFDINKGTANKLLGRIGTLMEMLYNALKATVRNSEYVICDETYMKVITAEVNSKGIHSKKAYFWSIVDKYSGLVVFLYDEGSRGQDIILDYLARDGRIRTIQSDGFKVYRTMGSEQYPNVTRLACLQHIKRRLKSEGSPKALEVLAGLEELYHQDHMHRIGEDGWTEEDHKKWRQEYAPPILEDIHKKLIALQADPNVIEGSELYGAVRYALNEWRDVPPIFTQGYYDLDTNSVERQNRYISLSRRNSLFHGSHEGSAIGAVFYSLACSCRLNGVNFFEYMTDILNRLPDLKPNTPTEKLVDLLPHKWQPQAIAE